MRFKTKYQEAINWAEDFSAGRAVVMQQSPCHVHALLELVRALSIRVQSSPHILIEEPEELGVDEALTRHAAIEDTQVSTGALKEKISELVELLVDEARGRPTEIARLGRRSL